MSRCSVRAFVLWIVLGGAIGSVATAEDAARITGVEGSAYVADAYVWRGQVLSDQPVLQPGLTVSYGDLSVNVWSNMNLDRGGDDSVEFNEIDFTVGYGFDAGRASMSAGVIEYSFPTVDASGTTELYFSADLANLPVDPSFAVYYDIDEADGLYATASIARGFELSPRIGLTAALSTAWASDGYNSFYFGVDDGALNDTRVSLTTTLAAYRNLGVDLGLAYMWLADSDIAAGADATYGRSDRWSLLLGFSGTF